MKINQLAPEAVWKNFSALNAIPRPSKKEEKVIAFIRDFGESLGLDTTVDEAGNVLIRKPATPGMEQRRSVVLQSHLDMVCQKNNDVDFDFEKDGIRTFIDRGWVRAEGTTLGADNGIGVAAIMSVLESTDIPHPPIEALFTIDEETGMTGAFGLKPGILKGEILLNLDTEEDDEIDIGCAGGVDITATHSFRTQSLNGTAFSIEIKGLQGGHSGVDIHLGRGNANVILRRLLYIGMEAEIQLLRIDGGGLRNAIPREAQAVVFIKNNSKYLEKAEFLKQDILKEYHAIEKDISIHISEMTDSGNALSAEDSAKVIQALTAARNGVYRMSPEVKGLVEASNNIARITLEDGKLTVQCLTRSSVESTKAAVTRQLKSSFALAGIQVHFSGDYPGWKPDPNSAVVALLSKLYQDKFGSLPKVVACHAGLECGIIGANYPDMEMASFGPTIVGAHSPDERVNIQSVQKFWGFLQEVLAKMPERDGE